MVLLKRNLKKLGYNAIDYDILNDYNETDFQIDLWHQINNAYLGNPSIFDDIKEGDQVLAFFPCIRFEDQIQMAFRGTQHGKEKWSLERKLEYDLELHDELNFLYAMVTKLAIIAVRKGFPLIIENPWSTTHYLVKYWCIPCSMIDTDRRDMGDHYKKPTQYWFINREPSHNFIFEPLTVKEKKQVHLEKTVDRSMITPEYANRFIREFIL